MTLRPILRRRTAARLDATGHESMAVSQRPAPSAVKGERLRRAPRAPLTAAPSASGVPPSGPGAPYRNSAEDAVMAEAMDLETIAHWWCRRCGRWEMCDDADLCADCRYMTRKEIRDLIRSQVEPKWEAVVWLLTAPVMVSEGAPSFVHAERRCDEAELLARAALNLWCGDAPDSLDLADPRGPLDMGSLLCDLEDPCFERLLEAMTRARQRRVVVVQPPVHGGGGAAREQR
jgi:ribosomal protein L37E